MCPEYLRERIGMVTTFFDRKTMTTFGSYDFTNTVEESAVVRLSETLIVNEFHFDRFHGRHRENRFGNLTKQESIVSINASFEKTITYTGA